MSRNSLIQFRKGTLSQFNSVNPVLASGEPGYAMDASVLKVGDGVTPWNGLLGFSVGSGISSVNGLTASALLIDGGHNIGVTTSGTEVISIAYTGVDHVSIPGISNVDNSGNRFIQDLLFDQYGHVTGVASVGVTGIPTVPNNVLASGDNISLLTNDVGYDTIPQYTLDASSPNHYLFSGPGLSVSTPDPTLYLVRGRTYKFTNSMGAHPFQFQSTAGIGGTAYTSGIDNSPISNTTMTWEVRHDTPNILYYQCTSHANMNGTVYILDIDSIPSNVLVSGDNISLLTNDVPYAISGTHIAITNAASDVNNSSNDFVQDLLFDEFGHVTGVVSQTVTDVDTFIDGSGTTNYLPVFSDSDTLTNSIINQSGNTIGINTPAHGSSITQWVKNIGANGSWIINESIASGYPVVFEARENGTRLGAMYSYGTAYTGGSFASIGSGGVAFTNITGSVAIGPLIASKDLIFGGGTDQYAKMTNTEFRINHDGLNRDFRVEGDSDQDLIVADASADKVGIGTASPEYILDVDGSGRFRCAPTGLGLAVVNADNSGLLFGEIAYGSYGGSYSGDLYTGMTHTALDGDQEYIILSKGDHTFMSAKDGYASIIRGGNNNQTYQLLVNSFMFSVGQYSEKMKFDSSKVQFNLNNENLDFAVHGDALNNVLYVDASVDRVGIGTDSPAAALHIVSSGGFFVHSNKDAPTGSQVSLINVSGTYTLAAGQNNLGNDYLADHTQVNVVNNGSLYRAKAHQTDLNISATGTVNAVYGYDTSMEVSSATTLVGHRTTINSTGNVGNVYGIWLKTLPTGTTATYGIYENNSHADNYFAGNVGVGTSTPAYKLDVAGSGSFDALNINDAFTFPTGDGSVNQILVTDGNGNVSWTDQSVAGGGNLTGNGTINFVPKWSSASGLTDSVIYESGANIGINTTNPNGAFEVYDVGLASSGSFYFAAANGSDSVGTYVANANPTGDSFMSLGVDGSAVNWVMMNDAKGRGTDDTFVLMKGNISSDDVKLAVTASGDVGIGNSSPSHKLDVTGMGRFVHADGLCGLMVEDTGGSGVHIGDCAYSDGDTYAGMKHSNHTDGQEYMIISAGHSTVVSSKAGTSTYIRAGGNATTYQGIFGTSSFGIGPNANRLRVNSQSVIVNNGTGNYDFKVYAHNTTHPLLHADADSGSYGRLGIGRSPDNYVVDISGSLRVSPLAGATHFLAVNDTSNNELFVVKNSETVINENQSNYDFRVEGDSQENLFFVDASTDSIGIATDTPGNNKFRIHHNTARYNSENTAHIKIQNSGSTIGGLIGADATDDIFYIQAVNPGTSWGKNLAVQSMGGNLGVGTITPAYKLDVSGTFSANSVNVNNAYTLPTADGTAGHSLVTDGAGNIIFSGVTGGGITDVVEDTTPQLGGNLDLSSKAVTGTGGINIVGAISGTSVTLGAVGTQHLSIIRDAGGTFGNTVFTDLLGDITIAAQNTKIKMTNPAGGAQSVITMNPEGADQDFIVEGDTDTDLLFVDASNDIVQIGKLNINGQYTFPTGDGTAGHSLVTDGAGNIIFSGVAGTHPSIAGASSSDNSGRTYIQDILLDGNGHVTGIATATETVTDTTYTAGSGLSLSGTTFNAITATTDTSGIVILTNTIDASQNKALTPKAVNDAGYLTAHPTITNAASSSDNSGRTYIQDIILDSHGHVTGVTTATETVTDTNTTYTAGTGIVLGGGDNTVINVVDDVLLNTEIQAGSGINLVYDSGNGTLTINRTSENIGNLVTTETVGGRLTLESGVTVSTTDQTAKTKLYFTPHISNNIALYNGSEWNGHTFNQLELSLSGYTADKNFDIFVHATGGTPVLESLVWTNDTTRATALTTQDGVYVKNGAATRRYLGTIRTTSSTGQCEDSEDRRLVWNYYNQTRRRMQSKLGSATGTHSYTTNAWRAYYNSTTVGTSRNEFVIGLDQMTRSDIMSAFRYGYVAFAYDSATVPIEGDSAATDGNQSDLNSHAYFSAKILADGYHYVQALQYGAGSNSLFHYMTMETHILC